MTKEELIKEIRELEQTYEITYKKYRITRKEILEEDVFFFLERASQYQVEHRWALEKLKRIVKRLEL